MLKSISFRTIIGFILYIVLSNQVYSGDALVKKTNSFPLIFFFTIAIISLLIAILLIFFAKQNVLISEHYIPSKKEPLDSVIFEEIDRLANSEGHQKKETIKKISNFFKEEVQKKVETVTQEISKKYDTKIKEQNQNLTMVQQKYTKLDSDKKQTESIIRSIAEGLVVVNNKGDVLLMNPVAKKLLEVKEKKNRPNLNNLGDEYLLSLKNPTKEKQEIVIQSSKDETKKVLRTSSAVIENEDGKTIGMVSILSDVTKQRELEEMKSNFISSVSHELRTPLISIQKSVDLILSKTAGPLTKEQENFLNITENNLKRLTHLIDDVLDLSKMESKKVKLELKSNEIGKIIDDICESLKHWADSKSIKIEKIIPKNFPKVNVDSFRVIQILNNLIGNAMKFTLPKGVITVKVQLSDKQDKMEISVSDTGIGIDEKDIGKVFDKFQQGGNRVSTDINGTGLGLFITKELVQLHGGEIWVESKKGQGTKFTFNLPL